jgi:hypothetical protein
MCNTFLVYQHCWNHQHDAYNHNISQYIDMWHIGFQIFQISLYEALSSSETLRVDCWSSGWFVH